MSVISYQLIRSERKTLALQIKDGKLIVRAPMRIKASEVESFVRDHRAWIEKNLQKVARRERELASIEPLSEEARARLAKRAREVIPKRVQYYAARLGVTYGTISFRWQSTRWGSCTGKGNLNFNCLLMLTPAEVIDSVVVHELCHRLEMNHSPRFYAEIAKVFPEYPKWNAWLKANGNALMKRIR